MKKKHSALLSLGLALTSIFTLVGCGEDPPPESPIPPVPVITDTWDGSSDKSWYVEANPQDLYIFETAEQLAGLAEIVNEGVNFNGVTITLSNHLNLAGFNWNVVATSTRSGKNFEGNSFAGTFDGTNKIISGLTIAEAASNQAVGLFGTVTGTIKNLEIKTSTITTESKNVGFVAGLVSGGTIDNCKVNSDCSLTAPDGAGGIAGRILVSGTITNSANNATITTTETAGGIVGKAYYSQPEKLITISNCVNNGNISAGYAAGGIVGLSAADVKNCVNNGIINATSSGGSCEAGGIVAEQVSCGNIEGNTNAGQINVVGGTTAGGIIGFVRYNTSVADYARSETIIIANNANTANIIAENSTLGAGGIVGTIYNQAVVTENINSCAVVTGGTFAGGIVGGLQEAAGNVKLENQVISVTQNTYSLNTVITGTCTHCVAYANDPSHVVENNTQA